MPDIRNIEEFKEELNSLGNEPEILEERGEKIEDITPPEEGLPSDLDEMLSDTSDLEEGAEGPPAEAEEYPSEEERPSVEEEGGLGTEGSEGTGEAESEVSGAEDLETPEDFEIPEDMETPEDFEMPEDTEVPEDFGEEIGPAPEGPAEESPEEASEETPAEGGPEEELAEAEEETGEEVTPEGGEEAPEEPESAFEEAPEEPESEDVSSEVDELLSELGDLDEFEEETAEEPEEVPEEEESEEPEEGFGEGELETFEEPEAGLGEDFDFSDVDIDTDLSELGDEFGAPEAGEEEAGEEEAGEAPSEAEAEEETPEEAFEEGVAEAPEAAEEEPPAEPFDEDMELPEDFEEVAPESLSEDDQFGDLDEEPSEAEAPEGEEEPSEAEAPEGEEEPTGEEEEFDLADIDADIEDLGATIGDEIDEEEIEEVASEPEGFEEPEEGPEAFEELPPEDLEAEGPSGEEGVEGLEEFDEEAAPPEEEGEEPEEAPEGPEDESFDVSGEFPFDEETEEFEIDTEDFEIDTEPSGEEGTGEEGTGEEGAGEEGTGEEEFDLSEFEEEDIEEPEQFNIPTADFGAPESADQEDIQGEDEIDEFSLGDLGVDIGEEESEEEGVSEEELNPATAVSGDLSEVEEGFQLSDEDFRRLQQTLDSLPRNLKIAVEELIGEQDLSSENLRKVVNQLVAGDSAKNIAATASKLLGRRIDIPKQYEKKTGIEFEEEKESFAYIFKHNVLPVLKVASLAAGVLALLLFLGYRFVYKPIHSQILYTKGYEEVREDNYATGNGYFDRATEEWPHKKWFYTYAEEYVDKNQFYLAEEKYEQLLSRYPMDKKAVLDYARLEMAELSNYEKAESILDRFLDENLYDYEAMLLLGDTYMRWADEDPTKYERARATYAVLLERYGGQSEVLFRMLRYFIRTDNYEEVDKLKNQFQANERITVNPQIYAELGGYLLDKGKLDEVRDILFRAHKVDPTVPAIHYHLSRYFNRIEEYGEEEKALTKALRYLKERKPYTRRELAMVIKTHNKLGEADYRKDLYLDAEQQFQKAKNLYEDAKDRNILGPSEDFGSIYTNLGDLYYYVSNDYETAYSLYEEAENNLYSDRSIDYKMGFINYIKGDYDKALLDFYEAGEPFSNNKNLMYSTANTLYKRSAFSAAHGYYNHLLDILENERDRIPYLMPEEQEEHKALMEMITKTYNNLGVTLNKLDRQSKDPTKYSESLRYLTKSTEYADLLARDPETLDPTDTVQLAFLNIRSIIYPDAQTELQIYNEIPEDMADLRF